MSYSTVSAKETTPDTGLLRVIVRTRAGAVPIQNAVISISYTGQPSNVIEEVSTDSLGRTEEVTLNTPPIEYSLAPENAQPYSEYNLSISAPGYKNIYVAGAQILSHTTAVQEVELEPSEIEEPNRFVIPPHTLYGEYPPKIAENEIKPVTQTGEIVLTSVVVPEFVIVHDGPPTDSSAPNHYVRYKDYIKNVASSEIYATWPTSTIYANILAIMSFTLNRVYTEWYRNKGFNFTITSSTAFDHKWMNGRNIYQNISTAVDELFVNYLSRPNVRQPILTQYCDGVRVQCPNWMTQWGSKSLGDQNYSPIEILRYYYGDNMYINTAEEVSGVPSSWPGTNLDVGSSGESVRQIQEQLNTVARTYPALPQIAEDGIFGESTAEAVRGFQSVFGLPPTGIIDYPTWYKIGEIYVAVSRIAEL